MVRARRDQGQGGGDRRHPRAQPRAGGAARAPHAAPAAHAQQAGPGE